MKERPIIFSAPMVSAILDGRKTQTRRIVKRADSGWVKAIGHPYRNWHLDDPNAVLACPYGQLGDRLWVRETWQAVKPWKIGYVLCDPTDQEAEIHYRATAEKMVPDLPWRPSIFMPRAASRITLEVASIRIERLCEISESDACSEGCYQTGFVPSFNDPDNNGGADDFMSARDNYECLWQSIHGQGSWEANPFVWVIQFKPLNQ